MSQRRLLNPNFKSEDLHIELSVPIYAPLAEISIAIKPAVRRCEIALSACGIKWSVSISKMLRKSAYSNYSVLTGLCVEHFLPEIQFLSLDAVRRRTVTFFKLMMFYLCGCNIPHD